MQDYCFLPYFLLKRSTRPSLSMNFCLPVKNGWHAEQISTLMAGLVERVSNLLPHAQLTLDTTYSGWIPFFTKNLLMLTGAVRALFSSLTNPNKIAQSRRDTQTPGAEHFYLPHTASRALEIGASKRALYPLVVCSFVCMSKGSIPDPVGAASSVNPAKLPDPAVESNDWHTVWNV